MESGAVKKISDVIIGDRILAYSSKTKSAVFSDVVAVPHAKNSKVAEFVKITTNCGKNIKMTAEHLVRSCEGLVLASKIVSESCIITVSGQEVVAAVDKVVDKGLYTVVTREDLIVVNGIVASPFAVKHFIPNMFYNFHRFVFGILPSFLSPLLLMKLLSITPSLPNPYKSSYCPAIAISGVKF